MKIFRQIATAVILLVCSNAGLSAWAGNILVVGIRGNETVTQKLIASSPKMELLESKVRERDDGTTAVKLMKAVENRSVLVLLPESLTPNTLMEALIKVRIARRAKFVGILSPKALSTLPVIGSNGKQIPMALESYFSVAGATMVKEDSGELRAIHTETLPKNSADKNFITGADHPELEAELGQILGIPVLPIGPHRDDLVAGAKIFFIAPAILPLNEHYFHYLTEIRQMTLLGGSVQLITPYQFYARSDKIDEEGTTVVGRLIADLIESVGTETVTFVRAHATQSEGFYNNPIHVSGVTTVTEPLKNLNLDAVVGADNGIQKLVTLYAIAIGNLPLAIINKERRGDQVILHGISGAEIKDKRVVHMDDESQSGGTLAQGAEMLQQAGAKSEIIAYTHWTGNAEKLLQSPLFQSGFIEKIQVTNSLPIPAQYRDKITVISVAPEIAGRIAGLKVNGANPERQDCIANMKRWMSEEKQ